MRAADAVLFDHRPHRLAAAPGRDCPAPSVWPMWSAVENSGA